MKRIMRWCTLLYPAAWRARYGGEFEALLQDAKPRWTDVFDVMKGAMTMHLRGVNFWKIAAAFTIAGALISGAWSLTVPDRYVSSAVLRIAEPMPDGALSPRLQALERSVFSRSSLAAIIQKKGLYPRERSSEPLEHVIQTMRNRDVRAQLLGDARYAVSFTGQDPAVAQATVRALVAAFAEANLKGGEGHSVKLEVVEAATLPQTAAGPDRTRTIGRGMLVGLVLGILCGGIWSLVRRRSSWSWKRIGGFAAAGMACGMTAAFLMPDEYISTAVLRAQDDRKLQSALQAAFSDASLQELIRKHSLYAAELRSASLTQVTGKMRNTAIRVQTARPGSNANAIVVSFRYTDRYKAESVMHDLVAEISGLMPSEVLDPPSAPRAPSSPNRPQIVASGILAGALLGLAAARFGRQTPVAA